MHSKLKAIVFTSLVALLPTLCLGFSGSERIINDNITLSHRHAEFFSVLVFLSVFACRLSKRYRFYPGIFLALLALHPAWWQGCAYGDGGSGKVENSFYLNVFGVLLLLAQLFSLLPHRMRSPVATVLCLAALTPIVVLGIRPNLVLSVADAALLNAAATGDLPTVNALVWQGAHVDARRKSNPPTRWEPLQDAWTKLERPDYPFQIGYTPLMLACIGGHRSTVEFLLNHGADARAMQSEGGRTPVDMAIDYDHRELIPLLVRHGAEQPPPQAPQTVTATE